MKQKRVFRILFENWKLKIENYSFYLQTDPNIIMQRDRKPDQGLEYLQKKKELYDAFFLFGPPAGGLNFEFKISNFSIFIP